MRNFLIQLKDEDEKLIKSLAKKLNTSQAGAVRYAVKNSTECFKMVERSMKMVDEYKVLNARTLQLLKDVLSSLPPDYQNENIDNSFHRYFKDTGKADPVLEIEVGNS